MDNSESGDEVAAFMHTAEGTYITADDEGDHVLAENSDDSAHDDTDDMKGPGQPLREQDRFLPIANVAKIMKRAIPETGKIAKDARECVQECVSEFISFITSEASDRCHMEKRKTINGEDILFAMTNLGFDNYVDPLKLYLQKYRETTKGNDKGIPGSETTIYEEIQGTGEEGFAHITGLTGEGTSQGEGSVIYAYTDQLQFN
ncbi:uncharacterized protein LOC132195018 isoform X1 [Neocloeon triangulifer]|uniref:uncharacterized protein LOC132195018 isoform X1 n=1 Tax=Neocloeon triangulifer TaxID=2078957 RepID=UPI00286EC527|nr:uncharacterized protein LOC132195018 isoform X1 [Neocloeon triangulifer]XP_059472689.1 uncharacterized protein LOC132195018 isoform X1 [Neocloeon triangulifer]